MAGYDFVFSVPGAEKRLLAYQQKYCPLAECFTVGPDYLAIIYDIKRRGVVRSVTDIGCAFGFQSEFFVAERIKYIGLDMYPPYGEHDGKIRYGEHAIPFYNEAHPLCTYHIGHFPDDLTDDMLSDCFVSNMSVGYGKETEPAALARAFSRFERGYFCGPAKVEAVLDGVFRHKEELFPDDVVRHFYYYR